MTDTVAGSPADNPGVIAWPPVLHVCAFAVALLLQWMWPLPIHSAPAFTWMGIALIPLGVAIVIWGRITMLRAGTNVNPSRPAVALVTSGPFRFSRNPLYVALAIMFCGLTLAFNTWWGFVVLVPVLIVMYAGVIRREERYLDRKFGKSYRQYCRQVRRYF